MAIEVLNKKEQGDKLTSKETEYMAELFVRLVQNAQSSRKNLCYTHNRLKSDVGKWYEYCGWDVQYEVAFSGGGFSQDQFRFDVVASYKKDTDVIEIKDVLNIRDMGQVHGYANILQKHKVKAKLYLATDILNWGACVDDDETIGETLKELMEQEDIGIIFIDKEYMIICDNYNQVIMEELPGWIEEEEE
jgi:hypothetical protein